MDDDYPMGAVSDIAYKLMKISKKNIEIMGLKDKSAGFSKKTDNLPPQAEEIKAKILKIIK